MACGGHEIKLTSEQLAAFKAAGQAAGNKYDEMMRKCQEAHMEQMAKMGEKLMGMVNRVPNGINAEVWDVSSVVLATPAERMYGGNALGSAACEQLVEGKLDMVRFVSGQDKDTILVAFESEEGRVPRQVSVEKNEQVTYSEVIDFLKSQANQEL